MPCFCSLDAPLSRETLFWNEPDTLSAPTVETNRSPFGLSDCCIWERTILSRNNIASIKRTVYVYLTKPSPFCIIKTAITQHKHLSNHQLNNTRHTNETIFRYAHTMNTNWICTAHSVDDKMRQHMHAFESISLALDIRMEIKKQRFFSSWHRCTTSVLFGPTEKSCVSCMLDVIWVCVLTRVNGVHCTVSGLPLCICVVCSYSRLIMEMTFRYEASGARNWYTAPERQKARGKRSQKRNSDTTEQLRQRSSSYWSESHLILAFSSLLLLNLPSICADLSCDFDNVCGGTHTVVLLLLTTISREIQLCARLLYGCRVYFHRCALL